MEGWKAAIDLEVCGPSLPWLAQNAPSRQSLWKSFSRKPRTPKGDSPQRLAEDKGLEGIRIWRQVDSKRYVTPPRGAPETEPRTPNPEP